MDVSSSPSSTMDVTIKNTFLDLAIPSEVPNRRCSSVPRSWMPQEFQMSISSGKSVGGEDSTTASDKSDTETFMPTSDLDSLAGSDDKDFLPGTSTLSSTSDSEDMEYDADSGPVPGESPTSKPMVSVKLFDFVGEAPTKRETPVTRTKLCSAARPFTSARAPQTGIQTVIKAAKDVLESDPSVVAVQMLQGATGGTCTLLAHTNANLPRKNPRYYLMAAKNALLTSSEHSRDTYLLGYEVKPFTKIDKCSFSATLATIPDSQQNTACWDSYTNGYCPRRLTCRWSHPCENQVMRLVIRVQFPAFESHPVHED